MPRDPLPPRRCASARADRGASWQHPLAAAARRRRARARGRPTCGWSRPSRASCVCRIGRPVDLLVRRGRRPAEDEQRQRARARRSPSPACRPGGWFGEGTVLKRETYRYNIQALRRSVVAGLPVDDLPLAARPQHRLQPLRDEPAQRAPRPVHRRARDRPHERPRRARRAQPGGAVPPGAVPGRRRAAAHHAAGTGLPGRPVAPARQRGAAHAAGAAADPRRVRRVRVLDLPALRAPAPTAWRRVPATVGRRGA